MMAGLVLMYPGHHSQVGAGGRAECCGPDQSRSRTASYFVLLPSPHCWRLAQISSQVEVLSGGRGYQKYQVQKAESSGLLLRTEKKSCPRILELSSGFLLEIVSKSQRKGSPLVVSTHALGIKALEFL